MPRRQNLTMAALSVSFIGKACLETMPVLDVAQVDERGTYRKGTFVANPAGTAHSVWSDEGCAVPFQWERPVEIIEG